MLTPIKLVFDSESILPTAEALEKQMGIDLGFLKKLFPVGAHLKGQFIYTLPVELADKTIVTIDLEIDAN